MNDEKKIALLIDADNSQVAKVEYILKEMSTRGRIVVKRAYGNWKKETLKNWETILKSLAIKPEQQFDYVTGKNATDMALVIDAINLLHRNIYDVFVLVASDSDYTPLAINLHESGVLVIGVGEKKTPESFRNSCDEFVYVENIGNGTDDSEPKQLLSTATTYEGDRGYADEIHSLLKIASNNYQDDEGYINVSSAAQYIKRAKPDFDIRAYGVNKLPELIGKYPDKYEMKKYKGKGTVNIIAYKCK